MTQWFGWHAIFGVNIPLALVTALFVIIWIPEGKRGPAQFPQVLREIDLVGMALFVSALLTSLLWLLKTAELGWWPLVASVLLWPILFWHSLKREHPFIDVRMMVDNRPLSATYLRAGVVMMIVYCIVYGFAQWLESSVGYSPAEAGLLMLPVATVSAAASLVGARTRGIRWPFIISIASALAGSVCLLFLHAGSPIWVIIGASLFFRFATRDVFNINPSGSLCPSASRGDRNGGWPPENRTVYRRDWSRQHIIYAIHTTSERRGIAFIRLLFDRALRCVTCRYDLRSYNTAWSDRLSCQS